MFLVAWTSCAKATVAEQSTAESRSLGRAVTNAKPPFGRSNLLHLALCAGLPYNERLRVPRFLYTYTDIEL